jgi:hypothetical protein
MGGGFIDGGGGNRRKVVISGSSVNRPAQLSLGYIVCRCPWRQLWLNYTMRQGIANLSCVGCRKTLFDGVRIGVAENNAIMQNSGVWRVVDRDAESPLYAL